MANLYLITDQETRSALIAAVERRIGVSEALTVVEDIAALLEMAAPQDVMVIASAKREDWLGRLLEAGFNNVYDGDQLIRAEAPAERLALAALDAFLGPVLPDHLDPGMEEARRFQPIPMTANQIPRSRLFIVNSMPKSGTLWMAAILERVLGVAVKKQIIISHVADLEVDWLKTNVQGAVTLVRDLRDVVVSWSDNAARTDRALGYKSPRYATIEQFYWEFFVPTLTSSERYYRGDLVRWLHRSAASYTPRIRYEDMLVDPVRAVEKVLNAWMIDYDPADVAAAAAASNFEAMARPGNGDSYIADQLRGGHARRGVAGGWRDELPLDVAADIDSRFSDYQKLLGYAGS